MDAIKAVFARCKDDHRAALVTYVTAGYPTAVETPEILLAVQTGGAHIIELGILFTEPLTDGTTIQESNARALQNGVPIPSMLAMKYCLEVAGRDQSEIKIYPAIESTAAMSTSCNKPNTSTPTPMASHARFGTFGGQYVPEALMECLTELEDGFTTATADPTSWEEIRPFDSYTNRPSSLHLAPRLTAHAGGARIWLKREDLNHTGSHKINNAQGQILLARRLGKTSIIAETGAGYHGVATATLCALFGMKCTVFMVVEDVWRQALNVFRMRLLGATVIPVPGAHPGDGGTLRDAVNQTFRTWVAELSTTHFVIGSAIGPHPYPTLVRTFQAVMSKLLDAVIACVGDGSNAAGMFSAFVADKLVALVGVETGGDGDATGSTHSILTGLDYLGAGPMLASWKESGRAWFIAASDEDALAAFCLLRRMEEITPAMETAHAVAGAVRVAKALGP
ncbi:tryptophan synthase [Penicillium capsulatum]|uniref:tryptophan synthase n=1 Tax=Penicillium capsulatum TaxID=69766 RepID=A0A9W9LW96_9EURO|nr:tryptophan synthase [Penicillium capsulatum]KAJ6122339.1 tryptophan synthase [Penicillium capsulatum]